jgi:hypothetical protein
MVSKIYTKGYFLKFNILNESFRNNSGNFGIILFIIDFEYN